MKKENNKMSCHSRVFLSGISTLFPRPLRQRVAVGRVRGFTLLELLIAVIIIAVLAAIAVSAYQKSVLKSRFNSLMPIAKTLAQGNEDYYLRNGQYTDDVNKLDIRATGNSKTQITLGNENQHKYVLLTRDDMNNNLRMYQQKSPNFPGGTHCEALIDDNLANWLCRDALKGTLIGNKYGYTVYSLSDETAGTLARIYSKITKAGLSDGDVCINNPGAGYACRGYATLENDAKCVTKSGYWNCNYLTFIQGSVCIAQSGGSCVYGTFDHSYCVGDSYRYGPDGTCSSGNAFNNYSVCYAMQDHACENAKYDGTSCCEGPYCTRDKCSEKLPDFKVPSMPTYP